VTRYAAQQGFYVERRFGWDCHGLPVEYEIDKKLGIKASLGQARPDWGNVGCSRRMVPGTAVDKCVPTL